MQGADPGAPGHQADPAAQAQDDNTPEDLARAAIQAMRDCCTEPATKYELSAALSQGGEQ